MTARDKAKARAYREGLLAYLCFRWCKRLWPWAVARSRRAHLDWMASR
jgi:hypothetical protein